MIDIIEFETERLRLRQWRTGDRAPFAALNGDPKVMEFFPALLDPAASDAMATRCESAIAARGWGLWAVETKDAGQFIGFVGLHIPVAEMPCSPCVEIGWRLAATHWGKGFASEAARGALRVGFETLDLSEIVAFTALCNQRSRAVMEKIGMTNSNENFEHPNVPVGSALRPHCVYRLSREDWKNRAE